MAGTEIEMQMKSLFDRLEMRNRVEEVEARKQLLEQLVCMEQPTPTVDVIPRRPNDHISRCAVNLSWLVNTFLVEHPNVRSRPYTTGAVTYELVKSAVKERGCRYVELIDSGAVSRGKPFFFISHGWGRPFVELVDQIIEHFKPENQLIWRPKGSKILQPEEIYVWLDIFAINQNEGSKQGDDLAQLKEVVEDCEQTLMILDKDGAVLTRIWCLFEAWHTNKKGPGALRLLCYGLDFNIFFRIFRSLTVLRAEATVQSDLTMILEAIKADIGFEQMDSQLKQALVSSLTGEIPSEDEEWTPEIGARLTKAARMLAESGSLESLDQAESLFRRNLIGLEQAQSGSQETEKALLLAALFDFATWLDQTGSMSTAEKESERGERRRAEALTMYQRVLSERDALPGPEGPETAEVLRKLSSLLLDLQRTSEAVTLLIRLAEVPRQARQDDLTALSSLLLKLGKQEEAERYEELAKKLPPPKFKMMPCSTPGFHKFEARRAIFEIEGRYTPVRVLGQGRYSVAVSCKDAEEGDEEVAVKKLARAFDDEYEANRVLRQVLIQSSLSSCKYLISLKRIVRPFPLFRDSYDDLYLVMRHFESDLSQIIRSKQQLTDEHFQYLMLQLLLGLQHMHAKGVCHNDLKPDNVMVNSDCSVGLADFDSASTMRYRECFVQSMEDDQGYIGNRSYRSPEKLLGRFGPANATKSDLWSCGLILGELLGKGGEKAGSPMFPGKDYLHVLRLIVAGTGRPSHEDLEALGANQKVFRFFETMPDPSLDCKGLMARRFPDANPQAIDLLSGLLAFNPVKRLTAYEALSHPWLKDMLQDVLDEEELAAIKAAETEGVEPLTFEWEGPVLVKIDEARRILYEEAKRFSK